jgi:hypothetical protein
MKQKRILQITLMAMLSCLLVIPAANVAAQTNFSGAWALNESKSNLGEGRFRLSSALNVKQQGNTITIESTRAGRDGGNTTTSETLTLDGKEVVNKTENRSSMSAATWSGNSLVIKSTTEMTRGDQAFKTTSTDTWTLDGTGNVLTIQSVSTSQRGDRTVTLVYDKK